MLDQNTLFPNVHVDTHVDSLLLSSLFVFVSPIKPPDLVALKGD